MEEYRPINYQTILAWVNQKKLASVYLFLGEEEYQKEEIISRIKKIIFLKNLMNIKKYRYRQ